MRKSFNVLNRLVYRVSVIFFLYNSESITASHTSKGTIYTHAAIDSYAQSNHGPDGALFLDCYIKPILENSKGEKILDAGCGAGTWAIYAAKYGAEVYAIDVQEDMIKKAKLAIQKEGIAETVHLTCGDVANLPYEKNFFDKAMSLCVACNLSLDALELHVSELKRVLRSGGFCIFAVPDSLHVVFTNGLVSEFESLEHISNKLRNLPENPDSNLIYTNLIGIDEVLSATFYINGNRLTLLTDGNELENGKDIWRKLPTTIIPNKFYTKSHYLKLFEKYGFEVEKIEEPCFLSEEERVLYNTKTSKEYKLGPSYVYNSPFTIFYLKVSNQSVSFM